MDVERLQPEPMSLDGEGRLPPPEGARHMTFEGEPAAVSERTAALDGWVAAFDREMEQSGDFATSISAMTAHGCFDVRAVVERWMQANPTGHAAVAQMQPAVAVPVLAEAPALEEAPELDEAPALEEAPEVEEAPELDEEPACDESPALEAAPALEGAAAPEEAAEQQDAALEAERTSRKPGAASSPDIAYFRSLLEGGIEREQIDEAFPGFRLVIDEAVGQYEAGAEPILSDIPPPPSREDLNDEIRGMRLELQASRKRGRRRWRARD